MNMLFSCVTFLTSVFYSTEVFSLGLIDTFSVEIVVALVDQCAIVGVTFAYYYLSEWITSVLFEIGTFSMIHRWISRQHF